MREDESQLLFFFNLWLAEKVARGFSHEKEQTAQLKVCLKHKLMLFTWWTSSYRKMTEEFCYMEKTDMLTFNTYTILKPKWLIKVSHKRKKRLEDIFLSFPSRGRGIKGISPWDWSIINVQLARYLCFLKETKEFFSPAKKMQSCASDNSCNENTFWRLVKICSSWPGFGQYEKRIVQTKVLKSFSELQNQNKTSKNGMDDLERNIQRTRWLLVSPRGKTVKTYEAWDYSFNQHEFELRGSGF